jgi:hypothetical protein
MEAMRCLKRRLSDLVYRQMVNDAKKERKARTGPEDNRERLFNPARPAQSRQPTLLGNAAMVLRSESPDNTTLTALIERLPVLATALGEALRQALARGVVFTQVITLDQQARGAVHRAVARWANLGHSLTPLG